MSMTHVNILMVGRIVSETQTDRQLKFIIDICIYIYIWEDRKRRGVGTFTWNHYLTLKISGSIKDIFENKAQIDSRAVLFKYIYIYYKFELSVCLCLTNYASDHQNVDMGRTYEG